MLTGKFFQIHLEVNWGVVDFLGLSLDLIAEGSNDGPNGLGYSDGASVSFPEPSEVVNEEPDVGSGDGGGFSAGHGFTEGFTR